MKICFYAPFKPLIHPNPSGDLIIANGLYNFLSHCGHRIRTVSSLRTRWIFWKPWKWVSILHEQQRIEKLVNDFLPDIWLTYHTYYKAPDILGPYIVQKQKIPYVIFQGIYSTKRRRDLHTGIGFILNRKALQTASHIFSNRKEDEINLRRIIPKDCLSYVPSGIFPKEFQFDPKARADLRRFWNVGETPVVLSAAMFRADVKTEGLMWVIRACGKLFKQGINLFLAIAGDGKQKHILKSMAEQYLPGRVIFAGKIKRDQMYRFYSAGDLFVFPGIRESLGMVFLEAQSCGLPVVAFNNGGIPEVVRQDKTGFLTPLFSEPPFLYAIEKLLHNRHLARKMGKAAGDYIREKHDLDVNYRQVDDVLKQIKQKWLKT
jgi:glycosyltransferase involved in cell wall biosynthesis